MTADANTQTLLLMPTLTAKIEEAIDLLCAAFEADQIDAMTSARAMNSLCDAFAYVTSGETATMDDMEKLRDAAQQIKDADQDAANVDRNWVE